MRGAVLHAPGLAGLHTRAGEQQHGGRQYGEQGRAVRGAMVLEDALEHRIGGRFAWISEGVCRCIHRDLAVVAGCASPESSRGLRRAHARS